MTDIAEITIRKVSNGWVVVCIGDGGTDEAIARDVDELCSVLRDVLGESWTVKDLLKDAKEARANADAAQPVVTIHHTTPPAVKTEGLIADVDVRSCGFCGRREGDWPACPEKNCPFTSVAPGKQAQ